MAQSSPSIESKIGIHHLSKLWSRLVRPGSDQTDANDWIHERITIHGLGLSLEETYAFLMRNLPSFDEFENWILSINDGEITESRIARINAVLDKKSYDQDTTSQIQELEDSEPVLSEDDLNFWQENGYVVLHDAVTPEQCEAAANALWDFLGMSPSDSTTWYSKPRDHNIMVQLFSHRALKANRESHRIHKAFAQLWGTGDLWCSIDRVSFNPPETDQWRFPGPRLHWDTNLSLPIPFSASGILYLTDTSANQGAFTCVPGFHRRIETWLKALPAEADPRSENLEALGAIALGGIAGDLIIWDERLPHGSSANSTERPRLAQYITLYPPTIGCNPEWK